MIGERKTAAARCWLWETCGRGRPSASHGHAGTRCAQKRSSRPPRSMAARRCALHGRVVVPNSPRRSPCTCSWRRARWWASSSPSCRHTTTPVPHTGASAPPWRSARAGFTGCAGRQRGAAGTALRAAVRVAAWGASRRGAIPAAMRRLGGTPADWSAGADWSGARCGGRDEPEPMQPLACTPDPGHAAPRPTRWSSRSSSGVGAMPTGPDMPALP